MISQFL